jgi:DNA replication protein DnaC
MTSVADKMNQLGLRHVGAHLDDILALATKRRMSPVQLLEHIYEREPHERACRSLERRLARSRIGRFKPMADFDWSWPKRIDQRAVESALALDFLDGARNIVLIAPQGLGKTMIAQNIAFQAVQAGHSVLFTTAAQLLLDLAGQESSRALDRRLRHYSQFRLLCTWSRFLRLLVTANRGVELTPTERPTSAARAVSAGAAKAGAMIVTRRPARRLLA